MNVLLKENECYYCFFRNELKKLVYKKENQKDWNLQSIVLLEDYKESLYAVNIKDLHKKKLSLLINFINQLLKL